jgi:hypothetical protein
MSSIEYIKIIFPEGRILRVSNLAGVAWDEDGNLGGILWGTYSIEDVADCAQMMADLLEEAQRDMEHTIEQEKRQRAKKAPKLPKPEGEQRALDEFDMRYWKTDWLKEDDEKSNVDEWIFGLLEDDENK